MFGNGRTATSVSGLVPNRWGVPERERRGPVECRDRDATRDQQRNKDAHRRHRRIRLVEPQRVRRCRISGGASVGVVERQGHAVPGLRGMASRRPGLRRILQVARSSRSRSGWRPPAAITRPPSRRSLGVVPARDTREYDTPLEIPPGPASHVCGKSGWVCRPPFVASITSRRSPALIAAPRARSRAPSRKARATSSGPPTLDVVASEHRFELGLHRRRGHPQDRPRSPRCASNGSRGEHHELGTSSPVRGRGLRSFHRLACPLAGVETGTVFADRFLWFGTRATLEPIRAQRMSASSG